jgi:hypothetical protein
LGWLIVTSVHIRDGPGYVMHTMRRFNFKNTIISRRESKTFIIIENILTPPKNLKVLYLLK